MVYCHLIIRSTSVTAVCNAELKTQPFSFTLVTFQRLDQIYLKIRTASATCSIKAYIREYLFPLVGFFIQSLHFGIFSEVHRGSVFTLHRTSLPIALSGRPCFRKDVVLLWDRQDLTLIPSGYNQPSCRPNQPSSTAVLCLRPSHFKAVALVLPSKLIFLTWIQALPRRHHALAPVQFRDQINPASPFIYRDTALG